MTEGSTPATETEPIDAGADESGTADTKTADTKTADPEPGERDTIDGDSPVDTESNAGDHGTSRTARTARRRMGNPVVWRDMRTRFDSLGTAAVIAIYVALLGLPVVVWYSANLDQSYALLNLGRRGINLFEFTVLAMLVLTMLVTPLQAASSIALERDRQTLMPMQITLLRPWQITFGKIRVAATFSMYLLVISAPMLAIAWTVGSVSIGHLLAALALLLLTILLTTTVTVFCSSLTKRTVTAAFLSMIALGAIMFGPSIGFFVYHQVDAARGDDDVRAPKVLLATNPVMALATAVGDPVGVDSDEFAIDDFGGINSPGNGPLSGLKEGLIQEQDGRLGFDNGWDGPQTTEFIFDGDIMFDANGNPVFDEFGNPVPADAEIDIDEDGNMVVLGDDGEPIAVLSTDSGELVVDSDVASNATASGTLPEGAGVNDTIPPDGAADGIVITEATAVVVGGDVAVAVGPGGVIVDRAVPAPTDSGIPGIPLWLEYIVFVVAMSAFAAWATTRRLRTPAATER